MDWAIRERRIRGDLNCVQRSKDFTPIYTRRWWILLGGLFIRSVTPLLLIAQLVERGIVVIIISLPLPILPKSLVQIRLRRILFPVGLIAQLVRALGCYYVVFRGRPWICVVVVTYPTHMFAAYTGKSWVQLPVGPPFFISFYDLKNDFYLRSLYFPKI